jgi:hypothetical protein
LGEEATAAVEGDTAKMVSKDLRHGKLAATATQDSIRAVVKKERKFVIARA